MSIHLLELTKGAFCGSICLFVTYHDTPPRTYPKTRGDLHRRDRVAIGLAPVVPAGRHPQGMSLREQGSKGSIVPWNPAQKLFSTREYLKPSANRVGDAGCAVTRCASFPTHVLDCYYCASNNSKQLHPAQH